MKRMSGLSLLLVRLVFRRYEWASFSTFLQLPTASEILRIYVVAYVVLIWLQEFYIATFSFFTCNFLLQVFLKYCGKCKSLI